MRFLLVKIQILFSIVLFQFSLYKYSPVASVFNDSSCKLGNLLDNEDIMDLYLFLSMECLLYQ